MQVVRRQFLVVVALVLLTLKLVACVERRQNDALVTAATSDTCNRIIREYSCEKSDYSQGVADVFLSCGPNFAPNAALVNVACAVNENGDYCNDVFAELDADQTVEDSGKACFNATECTDDCKTFLQDVLNTTRCCVALINEDFEQTVLGNDIDASLVLCAVTPEPPCPGPIDITPPDDPDTCTPQEFFTRHANYICRKDVAQGFIDAMRNEDECVPIARHYELICGRGPGDAYCESLFVNYFLPSSPLDAALNHPELNGAIAACENSSRASCPDSCKAALMDAIEKVGCCINNFNDTVNGVLIPQFGADVMTACGLESPGKCENEFSGSVTASAITAFVFMLSAYLVLFF